MLITFKWHGLVGYDQRVITELYCVNTSLVTIVIYSVITFVNTFHISKLIELHIFKKHFFFFLFPMLFMILLS